LEIKLPINNNLENKDEDLFKKGILKKDSSDSDEAGPSRKKVKIDPSDDLFDGFDITSLNKNELIATRNELIKTIDKPSSSKDDKSILERKLKVVEEQLNNKFNDNFLSNTNVEESSSVGVLDITTATNDQIKEAIKEINNKRAGLDQDSEEYEELLDRESLYEDILASREDEDSTREQSRSQSTEPELSKYDYEANTPKDKGKEIEK
jgi:hypothetical protein